MNLVMVMTYELSICTQAVVCLNGSCSSCGDVTIRWLVKIYHVTALQVSRYTCPFEFKWFNLQRLVCFFQNHPFCLRSWYQYQDDINSDPDALLLVFAWWLSLLINIDSPLQYEVSLCEDSVAVFMFSHLLDGSACGTNILSHFIQFSSRESFLGMVSAFILSREISTKYSQLVVCVFAC